MRAMTGWNESQLQVGGVIIERAQGDITTWEVDAIVNAANSGLSGGGGVDGAIHRAGGPDIMEECRVIGGCPTGQARITGGGNLAARYVIHAVGPIYNNGISGEPEKLASAYRSSLQLAAKHDVHSIAFPALSTGAYRYPANLAARIALFEIVRFIKEEQHEMKKVVIVLFDNRMLDVYRGKMAALQVQLTQDANHHSNKNFRR